jgi:hypothetical protein
MAAASFNFIERYRTLAPAVAREIVDVRHKVHTKLMAETSTMSRAYALVSVAFQLNRSGGEITSWFEKAEHDEDEQFFLNIDKAEAARLASLLLEEHLSGNTPRIATAVLTGSYGGRRLPTPDTAVLSKAKAILEATGKLRQVANQATKVSFTKAADLTTALTNMEQTFNGANGRAVIESVLVELGKVVESLRLSTENVFKSSKSATATLSEEVDMLWWNMGGWSELKKRPLNKLSGPSLAIVAGYELGSFVSEPPGPYGAYGILRHVLGEAYETPTNLKKAAGELGKDAAALITDTAAKTNPLFPVTTALVHAATHGNSNWNELAGSIGDVLDVNISLFELAVQAYRERALFSYGGTD